MVPIKTSGILSIRLQQSDTLKLSFSRGSPFDIETQSVEVTINDESIFAPSPDSRQNGFRRAELLIASNDGSEDRTTGIILGGAGAADPDTLKLFGNVNEVEPGLLSSQPFDETVFHNFALTLNFDDLTTQVFYSQGNDSLEAVTGEVSNDVSGQGQFHLGVLKKGLDAGVNIVTDGIQPSGIEEGITFGGIFEEDSSLGCISLES
ncbi:hypothetical protein MKZ38_010481 [Zalerion maritima]|uniref:Glycoside hydrolase 131 catalytic N-terminal domain-containing protein n=1 Tax=Zalerion maritima TaxID=339359 RepID=A0AAD5WU57_9PEZI|nr:hypothetical protein MKZ38_010481 [Zalerion maritima]